MIRLTEQAVNKKAQKEIAGQPECNDASQLKEENKILDRKGKHK